MPHNLELITTLAGGLSAALIFGFLSQRVGLSPIVGYLLGGVAVGPFTPGFVANQHLAEQLAEVGVILLMFGVGLQFHLKELLSVRRVAIPGAIVQSAVATGLGYVATRAFGWSLAAGVIYGLAISVASTVVLTRVLSDNRALNTATGHIAVGWLVVEDIFTVLVLVLLPVIFGGQGAQGGAKEIVLSVAVSMAKLVALVAVAMLAGRRVLPALLGYVARTRSRELFTLTVLVLALGLAVGSAQLFGASMALGAFLAGMIVGQSPFSARAASEALPLRDAFAVLFFVSVGMMFNPAQLLDGLPLTLTTLAIVLVGKPLAALLVVSLLRYPLRVALAVAVALAQVGEFSFIVATLGMDLKLLPEEASRALVFVAIVSITLNPLLYRAVKPAARWLSARSGTKAEPGADVTEALVPGAAPRALLIGHGPIGRVLARLLRDHGMQPVILELNYDTVSTLSGAGEVAIYGDATRPDILETAGVRSAASVIFTADGAANPAAIAEVRTLNPSALILARAKYSSEVDSLEQAGADVVFSSEGEIALSMVDRLLTHLGATRDEVHRERDRVRAEVASANGHAVG